MLWSASEPLFYRPFVGGSEREHDRLAAADDNEKGTDADESRVNKSSRISGLRAQRKGYNGSKGRRRTRSSSKKESFQRSGAGEKFPEHHGHAVDVLIMHGDVRAGTLERLSDDDDDDDVVSMDTM